MTAVQFCYWLQGYYELKLANRGAPVDLAVSHQQSETIMNHLAMVFKHDIDPKQGPPARQAALQALHDGTDHLFCTNESDLKPRC